MQKKTNIRGFTTEYEDDAKDAVHFLEDELNYEETKVFFDQARMKNQAEFADRYNHHYTLTYRDGLYTIIRHK